MSPTTTLDATLTSSSMINRIDRMLSPGLVPPLGSTIEPSAGGGAEPTVDTNLLGTQGAVLCATHFSHSAAPVVRESTRFCDLSRTGTAQTRTFADRRRRLPLRRAGEQPAHEEALQRE